MYLVLAGGFDYAPAADAKPVKPGKYLLISSKDVKFNPMDPKQPNGSKMGIVSGDPKTGPLAFIIEMPPGANAGLHSHTSEYHAVVLQGAPAHWLPHELNEGEPLSPGAYWFQPGGYDHGDRCTGAGPCRAFVMLPRGARLQAGGPEEVRRRAAASTGLAQRIRARRPRAADHGAGWPDHWSDPGRPNRYAELAGRRRPIIRCHEGKRALAHRAVRYCVDPDAA